MSYTHELHVAEYAVQRASILTQRVFQDHAKGTLSKDDLSPVTKGDFGAQCLIIAALRANFPNDTIVAEEEASALWSDADLAGQVWDLLQIPDTSALCDAESPIDGGVIESQEDMLALLDSGKGQGGSSGRFWAIDPIDGTRGFLRGGQYAVCLALIVDGGVKVGAIACPNLPLDTRAAVHNAASEEKGQPPPPCGVLFSANLGGGAFSRPLFTLGSGVIGTRTPLKLAGIAESSLATVCEGVEAAHSNLSSNLAVASLLGISRPAIQLDSQAKYCMVARGAADIYMRLPKRWDYEEKIWDHAAGEIIVTEAGGVVSDVRGRKLDFTKGRTLRENKGVLATTKQLHSKMVEMVMKVLIQELGPE